jgi:Tfp pilus assembly protein PilN
MGLDELLETMRAWGRQHTGDALLKNINTLLMLHEDRVYLVSDGRSQSVSDASDPDELAAAARELIHQDEDAAANILLLLPPSGFITTAVNMPGLAPDALRSALRLQGTSMLPAFEAPLLLAVDPDNPVLALWMPEQKLEALFKAFADRALFLSAVSPRALAMGLIADQAAVVIDQDGRDTALVAKTDGQLKAFVQTRTQDLAEEVFQQEWDELLKQYSTGSVNYVSDANSCLAALNTAADATLEKHLAPFMINPPSAQAARRRFTKGKRRTTLSALAAGIAALVLLPFLFQSFQISRHESRLDNLREQSQPAREAQATVRDFESQWGVLSEFPRQNLQDVLMTLQQIVTPGYLTSIEIEAGYISLEGQSADPQNLLEALEQNPMFTEVDFARATSNQNYYIDLRLADVNFPAYQEWYFPEAR